ncbi:MAG: T9SS type A sorting domain-containing protein [Bacteroidetes bacterium]|nr:T9SS type A sorting domain-containing protein [Bacteroidota bacterium]
MKSKLILLLAILIFAGLTYLLSIVIEKTRVVPNDNSKKKRTTGFRDSEKNEDGSKPSDAMESLQWLSEIRAYPEKEIPSGKFFKAFEYSAENLREINDGDDNEQWTSLGPNNIGGRSLCVAVHPVDTSVIFLGAASGGLWKSTTGGTGANAWTIINTGFPSSAVSSIAIDSINPNVMFIGTGENYGYMFSQNGLDVRVTRGMYGIGILKTTDGGNSWTKSLDWSYNNERGVWKVIINNKNHNILYAATSEGIYKSINAGGSWSQVLNYPMVMDLELNSSDTSVLYASIGNLTNNVPQTDKGIYKSTNSGQTWTKLSGGLPASWTGKTTLELYKGNQDFVYASIANDFSYVGYFKSTNAGLNWTQLSTSVPIGNQGWYNNGHIVKPDDPNTILVGTINVEKSTNGGTSFQTKSDWSAWLEGATPPGDPEGPDNFVHADVHFYAVNPKDNNKLYITADGGLYRSNDFGETFYSCNGGYVTSQFYATFANSYQDSVFCLGGLQDNRSAFYQGNTAWYKTFYGDGMSCAINSQNDQICYTEYTNGSISRSTDRGISWSGISPPGAGNTSTYCFVTPFISCRSNPQIMYVGGKSVYKSTTGGGNWLGPYGTTEFNGSKILSIASSHTGTDTLYCGLINGTVFRSFNGGVNWTNVSTGIPNRYVTDITVNPNNSSQAYITLGGFSSGHVFRTTNAGGSWQDITSDLPDVPHQCIVVDPDYDQNVYAGNDLGVYVTTNGGVNWHEYRSGMPYTLVFDLTIVYPNRKLRAATYGNGIFERKLMELPVGVSNISQSVISGFKLHQNYPNPFNPKTIINYELQFSGLANLVVYNVLGNEVAELVNEKQSAGRYSVEFDGSNFASGVYFYSLYSDGNIVDTKRMMLLK